MTTNEKGAQYYAYDRNDVLSFLPPGISRLLDVGCGAGGFGESVKQKLNAEVWGIEMNPEAATHASKRLDKVSCGAAEKELEKIAENSFDCVTFNDVLEHLIDPYSVLRSVKRILKPGGHVVASIPNIRFWGALKHILKERDFQYREWGIFDSTHVRFFTKRSIERMFVEQNLTIESIRGINEESPIKLSTRMVFRAACVVMPSYFDDMRFIQFLCIARSV